MKPFQSPWPGSSTPDNALTGEQHRNTEEAHAQLAHARIVTEAHVKDR